MKKQIQATLIVAGVLFSQVGFSEQVPPAIRLTNELMIKDARAFLEAGQMEPELAKLVKKVREQNPNLQNETDVQVVLRIYQELAAAN